MQHVKGPDFPGGGTIMGSEGIRYAYASGRGSVRVRARAHIEPIQGGKEAIIVSELPFMVKKGGDGGLITKIADLVREKKINGISDLRDESDRSGMRLVIELKRGGDPPRSCSTSSTSTPDAEHLRRQHGLARRRRAADPVAEGADRALRRPPARGRHPPHPVPAAPRRGARARPRGPTDRARQPRRGDRADPRLGRHRHARDGPDREVRAHRDPGAGDPRHAPRAAHRARVRQGPRGARRADDQIAELRAILGDAARIDA